MDANDKLNKLLIELFSSIVDAEEKALITDEFQDITLNDMHVIEAIGQEEQKTSSCVAKKLGVTMGTLTKAIDGLVKKSYVQRSRSESDKRVVLLSLLPKGARAYAKHAAFHEKMIQAAISQFAPEETQLLEKTLDNLDKFFSQNNNMERTLV